MADAFAALPVAGPSSLATVAPGAVTGRETAAGPTFDQVLLGAAAPEVLATPAGRRESAGADPAALLMVAGLVASPSLQPTPMSVAVSVAPAGEAPATVVAEPPAPPQRQPLPAGTASPAAVSGTLPVFLPRSTVSPSSPAGAGVSMAQAAPLPAAAAGSLRQLTAERVAVVESATSVIGGSVTTTAPALANTVALLPGSAGEPSFTVPANRPIDAGAVPDALSTPLIPVPSRAPQGMTADAAWLAVADRLVDGVLAENADAARVATAHPGGPSEPPPTPAATAEQEARGVAGAFARPDAPLDGEAPVMGAAAEPADQAGYAAGSPPVVTAAGEQVEQDQAPPTADADAAGETGVATKALLVERRRSFATLPPPRDRLAPAAGAEDGTEVFVAASAVRGAAVVEATAVSDDTDLVALRGEEQQTLRAYAARVYDAAMASRGEGLATRPVMPAAAPPAAVPAPRATPAEAVRSARLVDATAAGPVRTVDQVAGSLSLAVRDGHMEAVITLRPEALGAVRATISAGPDGLVIHLAAEHEAVGELLRAQIGELRTALAGHQVPVADVHVLHNAPPAPLPSGPDPNQWQGQQRPRSQQYGDQPEEQPSGGRPQDEEE